MFLFIFYIYFVIDDYFVYLQDENLDYECVLDIDNQSVAVDAFVESDATQPSVYFITCQPHQVRKYLNIMKAYYLQ